VEPFRILTGPAAPLLLDDINTDQIIPSAWLKDMNADLAQGLLAYMRCRPDGSRNPDFVLENPQYNQARRLVVGSNFGCGSSREHAVWALRDFGIRCVIARSHAEFFRENCLKNGVLPIALHEPEMSALVQQVLQTDGGEPFTVDLESCEIRGPGATGAYLCRFEIAPHERAALLKGLDDIGMTLKHLDAIEAWEDRIARARPFMQASIAGITAAGAASKRGA
jgi:3-isopropylmalate/(R)-2-methylmalate dehydratase small subunit